MILLYHALALILPSDQGLCQCENEADLKIVLLDLGRYLNVPKVHRLQALLLKQEHRRFEFVLIWLASTAEHKRIIKRGTTEYMNCGTIREAWQELALMLAVLSRFADAIRLADRYRQPSATCRDPQPWSPWIHVQAAFFTGDLPRVRT